MAKNVEKDGKMRDKLKEATSPDAVKLVKTVVGVPTEEPANEPPKESAQSVIATAVDKGDPVVSSSGETVAVISKPEAELLARQFNNKSKEATLPLDALVDEVKAKNIELQKLKKDRVKTSSRTVAMLRSTDPKGKRTCAFCGQRVLIIDMCSKKELCEVCAS